MNTFRVYMWAVGMLIGGGVLLAMGGHKMWIGVKNSSPTRMTYAQWVKDQPDNEWVELEQVHINWAASARIDTEHTRRGRVTSTTKEYFVAAWSGPDDEGPICCFLVVRDTGKQSLMEQAWNAQDRGDEAWFEKNAAQLDEVITVQGLARTGFDLDSEDERILRGLGNTAPQFRIIDIGETPASGTGFLMLLGGVAVMLGGAALGFFTWRGSRKRPPMYPAPVGYPVQNPPPGAPQPYMPHQQQPGQPRPAPRMPAPRRPGHPPQG